MVIGTTTKKVIAILALIGVVLGINGVIYLDWAVNPADKSPWTVFGKIPSSEIKIIWETGVPNPTALRYGIDPNALNESFTNTTLNTMHYVFLTDLSPDTTYYYRIGSDLDAIDSSSPPYSFRTAPLDVTTPFDFTVISDTQQMGSNNGFIGHVAKKIGELNTSFLAIAGDLVGDGSDQRDWDDFFGNMASITKTIPLVPVVGNHDSDMHRPEGVPNPVLMHRYFPLSVDSTLFYYSFNYSMVHFTIVHAHWTSGEDLTEDQLAWIEADLQAAREIPFRVVMFHCPLFDSGYFGNTGTGIRSRLLPVLERHQIDLIFSGHDHHYERLQYHNLTMITSGGGGAMQDPFMIRSPYSQILAYGPNYSRVWANQTHLELKTFTLDNILVDHLIIPKGGMI